VLSAGSMREPEVAQAIARAMAAFHTHMLAPARQALYPAAAQQQRRGQAKQQQEDVWGRVRRWYGAARRLCTDDLERLGLGNADEFESQLNHLHAHMRQRFPAWIGFCHNDLQYGNALRFVGDEICATRAQTTSSHADAYRSTPHGHVAAREGPAAAAAAAGGAATAAAAAPGEVPPAAAPGTWVRLIDYEYSSPNDVAFDVANHWSEYAADYHVDLPHVLDMSRLPSEQQQQLFCRAYVAAMHDLAGGEGVSEGVGTHGWENEASLPKQIVAADSASGGGAAEVLRQKAWMAMPLPHIMWGLWALIQVGCS
jgi:thiamine kinase-like enzyme